MRVTEPSIGFIAIRRGERILKEGKVLSDCFISSISSRTSRTLFSNHKGNGESGSNLDRFLSLIALSIESQNW
ncbi:hypothetical protein M513_06848 [Trichuris suis]|uniref:Uncharacterized protein n=1 Tax=Trichuris suis TaxID=68888 RepID=A0A085M4Y9_9BILA|nr:hypothetical protein M513_06848 [Trichuris suis]